MNASPKHRSRVFDCCKGLAILSVINNHTVFWSVKGHVPGWYSEAIALIDIPVLFFISGYFLDSESWRKVLQRGWRQFTRLLRDYLIIGSLVLLSACLLSIHRLSVTSELTHAVGSMLKLRPTGPIWEVWRVFGMSLWYLRVYLSALPIALLVFATPLRRSLPVVTGTCFVVYLLFRYGPWNGHILLCTVEMLTFYLTILFCGTMFRRMEPRLSAASLRLPWALSLVLCLLIFWKDSGLIVHGYKFPPGIPYMLYSSHFIFILCWLNMSETHLPSAGIWPRVADFLSWCGRNIYEIYLWQGMATSIPLLFVGRLHPHIPSPVLYGLVLAMNFAVTLTLVFAHEYVARIITGRAQPRRSGDQRA